MAFVIVSIVVVFIVGFVLLRDERVRKERKRGRNS